MGWVEEKIGQLKEGRDYDVKDNPKNGGCTKIKGFTQSVADRNEKLKVRAGNGEECVLVLRCMKMC